MTTLATADDFGKVKLFKYPCAIEGASSKEYGGHSSHVTKVKFSAGDKYVISTGGNDKTVLVWETDFSIEKGGMS
jgi:microtubule-associated protein-like 6